MAKHLPADGEGCRLVLSMCPTRTWDQARRLTDVLEELPWSVASWQLQGSCQVQDVTNVIYVTSP